MLETEARSAIAEARACGIAVVLVTGPVLTDLKRMVGSLDFLDAVVAENGATIEFPSRYSHVLASIPPTAFFDELRRRKIGVTHGLCE